MTEFILGATYYGLTFADRDHTMPGVEPMVYVGINLTIEDGSASDITYYFQTTVSYMRFGPATSPHTEGDIDVIPYSEDRLGDVFTLQGIVAAVSEAASRAASLNYPKLKTTPGNWQRAGAA